MVTNPSFEIESALWQQGYQNIAGIDEAGRGALAGPVVVGVVIFSPGERLPEGIDDSKKLAPKKREYLSLKIKEVAESWAVGFADNRFIDSFGICPAIVEATKSAVNQLLTPPDFFLFDYMSLTNPAHRPCQKIVRGDGLSLSIAAASILAKVARDNYMVKITNTKNLYQFDKHKGYGTTLHKKNIQKYGISHLHRKSFIHGYL